MVRASAIAAPAVKTASTSASGINFLMLSSLSRHRSERVYVEIGWSLCSAQNGMLHCNNIVGRGRNLSSFRNNRFANRAALIRAAAFHPEHGLIARGTRVAVLVVSSLRPARGVAGRFQQKPDTFRRPEGPVPDFAAAQSGLRSLESGANHFRAIISSVTRLISAANPRASASDGSFEKSFRITSASHSFLRARGTNLQKPSSSLACARFG
jgi:hypothetical protein